jgi:hypothetical protein
MEAVDHDPSFAAKVGVPQGVGRDFVKADEGKHQHGTTQGEKKQTPHRPHHFKYGR